MDLLKINSWQELAEACENGKYNDAASSDAAESARSARLTHAERFIACGTGTIAVKGFFDGKDSQLDIVR